MDRPTHLGSVLVVDDDASVRRACAKILGHDGWLVTTVENGREAVAFLTGARGQIDCVLSDVQMPELDGFQLAAAVRRDDEDLPVLLMTGDPTLDGAVRAIDSGAVSYIAKPFDQEQLASAVARAARRHGTARMRRRAESIHRGLYGEGGSGTSDAERDDLARRLRAALDSAWMAFQPIVDITTGRPYAYEALVRTEEATLRRPDILIGAAERLGQIHELGRIVRAAVARAIVDAPPGVLIFVNVHGLELTDEELFAADGVLSRHAARVVLEITERTGLDEVAAPRRVAMLRKLGYRIAVDDLGAGYAALGALATIEPEIVKLDMSLIRGVDENPTKRRVVGAIATLCRELGSRVVAEGVETVGERDSVIDAGVELIQGYLLAKPARGFQPV
jgi:EAL domain-containing protein (putative c-di-GMP-specific phosphodiesterase class I)/CheY-like chemotaxis protein